MFFGTFIYVTFPTLECCCPPILAFEHSTRCYQLHSQFTLHITHDTRDPILSN